MKLAFIGTGNMGGALARAAAQEESNELLLVNRHPEKAERLRQEIGGTVTDHAGAVGAADYLFIGVKPVALPQLCETLRPLLEAREGRCPVIVSMAAGVTIRTLQEKLGEDRPVIRIMPNTPVGVGEGMILYSCSGETTAEEAEGFLTAMRHAGRFMKIEERLMEAGMAVSGCGPAYVDLFVEALADAAVACGLPRKDAITLAAQMVLGSAKLILESGRHPGELKDAVCSPGGTTIQGVRALEARAFRSAVFEAVMAAHDA
jgi:pyrroline-5-carboxylate reductase